MKLNRLKLVNFRCFRNREFLFPEGVVGIVGSNGKGKSRIVEAICFLFTGWIEKGTKEEAITLGEATGYVLGEFEHDGVVGTLERHLDASKVRLRYGDQDLKKSGEVNELWSKLLQINPEIFNNVIVSKQGEIPKLFSGDKAERTSIFQKIFLVPNTEKLKDIIWKDYIKQLPPPYPVDDLQKIEAEIAQKKAQLVVEEDKFTAYSGFTQEKCREQQELAAALRKAVDNKQKREQIANNKDTLELELKAVDVEIVALKEEVSKAPFTLEQLKDQLNKLERARGHLESKGKLEAQWVSHLSDLQLIPINEINEQLARASAGRGAFQQCEAVQASVVAELNKKIAKYSNFSGKMTCPTCGQSITEITKILTDLRAELVVAGAEHTRIQAELAKFDTEWKELSKQQDGYTKLSNAHDAIQKQLDQYAAVEYDPEDHKLYRDVFNKLEGVQKTLGEKLHCQELLLQEIDSNNELFDSLSVPYVDELPVVLAHDIQEADKEVVELTIKLGEKSVLDKAIAVINSEITNLHNRIEQSKSGREKNERREKFEKVLLSLYDAFHPQQFSRKVIQRYSGVVTDYLLDNLSKFSIPYTARVNDDFGIDVMNDRGLLLPIVSGGQAMMIGLCMRLALLQLFAQNFSFIVLDEASTGLHKTNKDIYFDLIKRFPRSQFRQVIIVDHDDKLADVVDHVINLDGE